LAIILFSSCITLMITAVQLFFVYQNDLDSINSGIEIVASLDSVYRQLLHKGFFILLTNGLETFMVAFFSFAIFQHLVTRHLITLGEYAKQVQPDHPSPPCTLDRKTRDPAHQDELDSVVTAINAMQRCLSTEILKLTEAEEVRKKDQIEKQELESRLSQAQKMEAIGTLAGGIAHDFNNILAAILGYADMARDEVAADSILAKDLDQILVSGNRAKELVQQILAFSRNSLVERIAFQPSSIVKEALKLLRASLPTTIKIQQDIDSKCGIINADPTQLHQILMNLCTNAFHAMEEKGGELKISLKKTDIRAEDYPHEPDLSSGMFIELTVQDSGPGIDPTILGKIFDPYFTTKEIGKGTGMGLSIIHGIVKAHRGLITVESSPAQGTAFHVSFPAIEKEQIEVISSPVPITQGKGNILFVDDEQLLIDMSTSMLERLGYTVTARKSGFEAMEIFRNQPQNFDLVITDQTMPGITGADLARQLLHIRPDIPIILCTGYSTIISEKKAKAMGIREFALKPLVKKDIAALINKIFNKE